MYLVVKERNEQRNWQLTKQFIVSRKSKDYD
jgi:hypothetical protein